ncbi:MAG: hypothetical protein GX060_04330 [Firmicutes bacterium]|nr:hypothetical protein [Bacillota bacterium]
MNIWRGADIAQIFGVEDEGLVQNGVFCLSTPFGPAAPSVYRGDVRFLQWLGAELPSITTRLGRLGLSRLLPTPAGQYYANLGGEYVLLATLETGPICDVHNAFELFTVSVGLAHVHAQDVGGITSSSPDWSTYYQAQRDKLEQIRPPDLSRRARAAWALLEESWQLCIDEAVSLLADIPREARATCLTLGLKSFSDFIYLPDLHRVHYNPIANCRLDSPAVDIARLLLSASGDVRVIHNMLLSYQRVREIPPVEGQEILAHLWFPHEIDLQVLGEQGANTLSVQRHYNLLRDKIAMIAEVEDLLSPFEQGENNEEETEVLSMAKRQSREARTNPVTLTTAGEEDNILTQEQVELVEPAGDGEPVNVSQPQEVPEPAPEVAEEETVPRINLEAKREVKPIVWGPFPKPLGAADDEDDEEDNIAVEQEPLSEEVSSEEPDASIETEPQPDIC